MKTTSVVTVLWALASLGPGTSQAADVIVFRDDFNGTIDERWAIVRPDASYYSVTDTHIDVRANLGDICAGRSDAKNIFLIGAPIMSDFTLTMKVIQFVPNGLHATQVDLLAFDDEDNHVRCNYGSMHGGRHLEFGVEKQGTWTYQLHANDFGADAFWLRLQKTGSSYTQWYSTDGADFLQANEGIVYGDGTPMKVGFVAMVDPNEESHALIDYFSVSVPDVDGDGMPDFWEEKHFGDATSGVGEEDTDQDGMTNLNEFIVDTHPKDAGSRFRVTRISREDDASLISFPSSERRLYTLQYTSDLTQEDGWTSVESQKWVPGINAWTILRNDVRYYDLADDCLDLRSNSGDLWTWRNDAKNVFLIHPPTSGDFSAIIRVIRFVPNDRPSTQIDLLAYDDDENHVRCAYGSVGGVRNLQFGVEVGGVWTSGEERNDFGSESFWLRLRKEGNKYTQWHSTDGVDFVQGNGDIVFGDGTPAMVGFAAMVDPNEETRALIDYFEVTAPGSGGAEVTLFRDDFNGKLSDGILSLRDTTDVRQRFYRVMVELF